MTTKTGWNRFFFLIKTIITKLLQSNHKRLAFKLSTRENSWIWCMSSKSQQRKPPELHLNALCEIELVDRLQDSLAFGCWYLLTERECLDDALPKWDGVVDPVLQTEMAWLFVTGCGMTGGWFEQLGRRIHAGSGWYGVARWLNKMRQTIALHHLFFATTSLQLLLLLPLSARRRRCSMLLPMRRRRCRFDVTFIVAHFIWKKRNFTNYARDGGIGTQKRDNSAKSGNVVEPLRRLRTLWTVPHCLMSISILL